MARLARAVVPGYPHHLPSPRLRKAGITQRGNRRQQTFFDEQDYPAYLGLMAEWCGRCGVEVWAYCLMPNHLHLVAVPASEEGLARGVGEGGKGVRNLSFC